MATVTLTQLRARARERADMVGSDFIADAADGADNFINEGLEELHEILATKYGADYTYKTVALSVVAGTEEYALPADFFKLLGIDLTIGGQVVSLAAFTFRERAKLLQSNSWSDVRLKYHVQDGQGAAKVRLLPKPAAAYSGTIYYVPAFTRLANPSDTTNFPNGWETYAIVYAAIRMLGKEESEIEHLWAELKWLRQRIVEAAENRDVASPFRVVDVSEDDELI